MRAKALAVLGLVSASCKRHSEPTPAREEPTSERDEAVEEHEEEDQDRDNYWRVQITIVGRGSVKSFVDAFDCTSDGKTQAGRCGPGLVKFKELHPPLLRATGAPGWKLDHWESQIRRPDGTTAPRKGPMPDGRLYINGFGYADTGELETVKAVFVAAPGGHGDAD